MRISKLKTTDWVPWVLPIVALPTIFFATFFILSLLSLDRGGETNWKKQVKLCDEVVETLLNSKDLVEITRAGIIINRLECSIGRRLP